MTFTQSVKTCLSKYAVFSGRASRSEYWWFVLFYILCVGFVPAAIGHLANSPGLSVRIENIVFLVLLLPNIAAVTRRLHDTGRSGWWQLIPLVPIIWLVQDTEKSDNKYGPYESPAPT